MLINYYLNYDGISWNMQKNFREIQMKFNIKFQINLMQYRNVKNYSIKLTSKFENYHSN